MTREELVEELNKIDSVSAELYELKNTGIWFIEIFRTNNNIGYYFATYYEDNALIFSEGMKFENRTPEQVLSAVKALVE